MRHWGLFLGLWALSLFISACKTEDALPPSVPPGAGSDTITLNPSTVYQTMTGWDLAVLGTVRDYYAILPFMGSLLDQAANDVGINKITIAMGSGVENPSGTCQEQYLAGETNEGPYAGNCVRNSVNDNDDPDVINLTGFHFVVLDWQIENMVLPLKQRVEARGEKLYTQLRYNGSQGSPFSHYQNPAEYAELMQVVFDHMRTKYGFVPSGVDIVNEPDDIAGWDRTTIGTVAARTGQRLAALGYSPDFVGPSVVDKGRAVPFFEGMMAVSGASLYVKQLSWHCYADNGVDSSAAIGAAAQRYGVRTSMTECWSPSNTHVALHRELKDSRSSSWQLGSINSANGYYQVDTSNGQSTLRPRARYLRQYFKYIRAGARRIDATTADAVFDPVAFINTDGRYVVVVKASAAGSFTVGNLPAGTYGVFYTTGPDGLTVTNYDAQSPDQTIASGRSLSASIPGAGVLTIYAKTRPGLAASLCQDSPVDAQTQPVDERLVPGSPPRSTALHWPLGQEITTRDGVTFRLEQISGEIEDPVDVGFTPDGRAFVAERHGRIRVVHDSRLVDRPALVLDRGREGSEELLSLAIDPQFGRTGHVFTISTIGPDAGERTFVLSRFREAGGTLADRIVLLDGIPSMPGAARAALRFGPDGKLFAAFDDAGADRLGGDLASVNGKILRINPDGSTPEDQAGGSPVFSYAYHSPSGLGWHPATQALWIADSGVGEFGRLNVVATTDRPLRGLVRATLALPDGSRPSSLAFYRGAAHTSLDSNLFVASDSGRQLLRIRLDSGEPLHVLDIEGLLSDVIGGIQVVGVGPDGAIYLGTASAFGRLVPHG